MTRDTTRIKLAMFLRLHNRMVAAVALVLAITIPILVTAVTGILKTADESPIGVEGDVASGWTDDTQVFNGGGEDAWPTMISSGDSIYVAFSRFDSGTGSYRITVMESIDGGLVWSEAGDFAPGTMDCKYPAITVYNGFLFVAFQYDSSATDHDIYCYKSSAGGAAPWTQYTIRADSNDDLRPAIDAVTIQNYAGVYVAFETRIGGPDGTDILMYKSTGDAFSFLGTVIGGGDPGEYAAPDIAVYQDQNTPVVYVAYQRLSGTQNDIYFIRTQNGGSTWSSQYQVTSNANDEYAPSISVYLLYALISYVMFDGDSDVYAIAWNGAAFGTPQALANSPDNEGWPEAYNLFEQFYVFYSRGAGTTSANIYLHSANGALNPSWGYPDRISDTASASGVDYRPAVCICDRSDGNLYFAASWGDYRSGLGDSDIVYTTQGCRYTVTTDPLGLEYTVDGATYTSEQVFNWPAGFQHSLTASDGSMVFLRWDDGANQWLTPTLTPVASTTDVTITAVYTAIPEFGTIVLPIIGLMPIILISAARRIKRSGSDPGP